MKILCRVDGNANIGSGHLMRCLALSQALQQENITVTFIIQPSTNALCQARLDWVGELILLPESLSIEDEVMWISDNVELEQFHLFLLDGYQFNAEYRYQLTQFTKPLVLFDDNNNSGMLYGTLIINGSEHAQELNYNETAPQANLCIGSKYRVLRNEFISLSNLSWEYRNHLTLIMGGSDHLNITLPLLIRLVEQGADMPIEVITGSTYHDIDALNNFINNCPLDIHHRHNCQNVAELFLKSKLVVSAAGSSQFELLACASPSILLVVADNQLKASQSAAEQDTCMVYNCLDSLNVEELSSEVIDLWHQPKRLEQMHLSAIALSDIKGAARVVNCIKKLV